MFMGKPQKKCKKCLDLFLNVNNKKLCFFQMDVKINSKPRCVYKFFIPYAIISVYLVNSAEEIYMKMHSSKEY